MKITREEIMKILDDKIWINDECGFDNDGERIFQLEGIDAAADAIIELQSSRDTVRS